ncbi:MAG: SCO family protein [Deltaproteobacteria bacterium]|nr:SCO family protein [Deltaproteobacteria bacterium]
MKIREHNGHMGINLSWMKWMGFVLFFAFLSYTQVYADSREEFLKDLGGDFTLTNQDNKPFALKELRGKVVFIFFGYTFCPDICPTALSEAKAIRNMLGDVKDRMVVVFISVDPERDKPEILKKYLANFDPSFIGLTGSAEEVAAVAKLYRSGFKKAKVESAGGYLIDHTSYFYMVNKKGALSNIFSRNSNRNMIVHSIKELF